jgi:hypothetical protein
MADGMLWHRIQLIFTITYHYLFPQLTVGLALLNFVLKIRRVSLTVRRPSRRLAALPQGRSGPGGLGPSLPAMKTSWRGNFSKSEAGLPKLVASTSSGFPAIHCDRSIVS